MNRTYLAPNVYMLSSHGSSEKSDHDGQTNKNGNGTYPGITLLFTPGRWMMRKVLSKLRSSSRNCKKMDLEYPLLS